MVHDMHIVLQLPPGGVYTFEDLVTGRVVLESHHEETIGWVYVFLLGWANVEVHKYNRRKDIDIDEGRYGLFSSSSSSKAKNRQIILQYYQKVYEGHEKLHKKTRHVWPFQFSFQTGTPDPTSLPTSGKYYQSSVEYKVIAVAGQIGQTDNHIASMNSRLSDFSNIISPGIFHKSNEKTAEMQIQFAQITPKTAPNLYVRGPQSAKKDIAKDLLPEIARLDSQQPQIGKEKSISFSINAQIPPRIVIGKPFTFLLSVTSEYEPWIRQPPRITLTSFKIQNYIVDTSKNELYYDEQVVLCPIWEGKRLSIPLSAMEFDIGQVFSLRLAGKDVVPSFNTGLLLRKYDFLTELTVDVAGTSFKSSYAFMDYVEAVSQAVAGGGLVPQLKALEQGLIKFDLEHTHLGRLVKDDDDSLQNESMMETAIALSKTLITAGIKHCFPGGSLIKLLPSEPEGMSTTNQPWSQEEGDIQEVRHLFEVHSGPFRILPNSLFAMSHLHLKFTDPKHGRTISIHFPEFAIRSNVDDKKTADDSRRRAGKVHLDPISLLNYRLWCLATNETLGEPEIGDIESLYQAFKHELRKDRNLIDVQTAKIAARKYSTLARSLMFMGVVVPTEDGSNAAQSEEGGWSYDYERELVQRFDNNFQLDEEEVLPPYEP